MYQIPVKTGQGSLCGRRSRPPDSTLDAGELTPAVRRMRLIVPIGNGACEDAGFLPGRLDEADHDQGERADRRALASFASDRLARTIRLVHAITTDAIDGTRAAWPPDAAEPCDAGI
ncbi:hypothetical protein [Rhodopila globiformis]|uniref:Uncharacterized protein n=1 Tax=Rhodopila globiformis TaxID=1071 RepID=A0A2S6NNB3_RHOGL|nr:hypothetical protein [Rhodopila globiformis]PPQ38328.1 hypothetical protein CCS01_02570 [Rhodopila globiformis]